MKTNEKTTTENAGANARMDANDIALALETLDHAVDFLEGLESNEDDFKEGGLFFGKVRRALGYGRLRNARDVLRAHFGRKGGAA
ncbi:MAG: hypothetical protein LBC18_10770 [Opitutaceae bacterium]|jgi:hypothetical protein|nr:hypothetical protein [Opitutaceae bacterium]